MSSPVPPPTFSAVVLAAGHSIRMHRDKALLPTGDGRVAWQRQREVLAAAGAVELLLSARTAQSWAETAEGFGAVVRDPVENGGPLAGIVAALQRASHPLVAVLAVDLPAMAPEWFQQLQPHLGAERGAIGIRDGFFEPLAGYYPRALLPLAEEALEARVLSLQKLLRAAVEQRLMHAHEITDAEAPWFVNRNQPG